MLSPRALPRSTFLSSVRVTDMADESPVSTVPASAEGTEMVPRTELVALVEAAVESALTSRSNPGMDPGECIVMVPGYFGRVGTRFNVGGRGY